MALALHALEPDIAGLEYLSFCWLWLLLVPIARLFSRIVSTLGSCGGLCSGS